MTATVKVDSGGCHVNGGRGGGHFRRGQPTRQHPFPPGTLSPTAATKVLATASTDETTATPVTAGAMSAQLPADGSDGEGCGGWGCSGLA